MRPPDWIKAVDETGWIDCTKCGQGIEVSQALGKGLVQAFVIYHAVHDREGRPAGLTPTGRMSKAAAREIVTWQDGSAA